MSEKKTTAMVRRNTAMSLGTVLTAPAVALLVDTVPVGAALYGFDPTDPLNEELTFRVSKDATREPLQHIAEPFLLKAWAVKKVPVVNQETGETEFAVRTTLIDPEGDVLAFVSGGVLDSLDLIRTLRGDGPYDPALPIVVVPSETRRGRRLYKLEIKRPAKQAGNSK